jgi:TRAP-type transport system periplasmic protein
MKLKKLFIFTVIAALLTLAVSGCSSSSASKTEEKDSKQGDKKETITLKLATYYANTSLLWSAAADPWMKRVTELTDGQVQFEAYPGEQLGKAHDLLQLTKDGVTDIGIFPVSYVPDNMPLSNMIAGLPNLSENSLEGTMAYDELLEKNKNVLETDYTKNGITPIFQIVSPTYEIWSPKKEIRTPADLKGLKLRTPGGIANDFYQSLGVVPVAVSHTETYEALEKGVIDAVTYYSMAVESSGTTDLLKYATYPHIGTTIHPVAINNNVWNKLPEDVQKAMIQAGKEQMEAAGNIYADETAKFNENFGKNAKNVELTKDELAKWEKAADDFNKKWLKDNKSKNPNYEGVLKQYKELLEKQR